jgi:hypothetical protein
MANSLVEIRINVRIIWAILKGIRTVLQLGCVLVSDRILP